MPGEQPAGAARVSAAVALAGRHSAFGYHWGRHANDATCAIHGLLFRDLGVLEEGDDRVAAAARHLG